MTSDSDKLEVALRENLELRRVLSAEVAKAKDSSTSQRVSRGFHRLGLLLGSLAFMIAALLGLGVSQGPIEIAFVVYVLVGLLTYGIIRAIGWIIGGFAA